MNKWIYLLIVLYVAVFIAESIVVGRWAPRIAHIDTWLTLVLGIVSLVLLIVSVRNLKDPAGKIGAIVAFGGWLMHLALNAYFN